MNDQDEFAGQGGSYTVDKDGKRQLVQRTQAPEVGAPKANDTAQPAPASADSKPAKSKTAKE